MIEEYLVTDCKKVVKFIDDKIGIESEITYDDDELKTSGSVTVFDIEYYEHQILREFISKNGLWGE